MKILLHTCCGPCSIYPVKILRRKGHHVAGFFYRHNIHPFTEMEKRQQAVETLAEKIDLKVIYQKDYTPEIFIRNVVFRENQRCRYCYHDRLRAAARIARRGKFDFFTTTLLYSKHQMHALIRSIGEAEGETAGVPFLYEDFSKGWQEGIDASKAMGLYRQQYCGCIYSEKERYRGRIEKLNARSV